MRSRSRDAGRPGGAHTPPDVARGKKGPGRRRDHIRKNYVVTSEKTSAHFRNWHLTKHTQDGARADAVQPEAPQAGSPAGSSFSGGVLTLGSEKGAVLGSVRRGRRQSRVRRVGLLPRAPARSSGGGLQLKAVRFRAVRRLAERYDVWYRSCDSRAGWLGWASVGEPAGVESGASASPPSRVALVAKGVLRSMGNRSIGCIYISPNTAPRRSPSRATCPAPSRSPCSRPCAPASPGPCSARARWGLPWAGVSCEVDWSGPTIGKDVSFVSLYTVCVKLMLIKYPLKL